jgi:MFS family permease
VDERGDADHPPSRASTLVAWEGNQRALPDDEFRGKDSSGVDQRHTSLLGNNASNDPSEASVDPFLISFTLDDARHPFNWSSSKKWTVLILVCLSAVCVTVASSIQASTYSNLEDEFGVPRIGAVAGVSLYVLGFGIGACACSLPSPRSPDTEPSVFLGPLSEFYGRSIIYLVSCTSYLIDIKLTSVVLFTILNIPIATAQSMGIILFFRLATGLCGAGFLSVAGGTYVYVISLAPLLTSSVSDLFPPGTTDLPTAVYTLAPLSGPCLGPILGGYLNQNVTWRATFYLIIAWSAVQCVALYFFVPETFLPVILRQEARKKRAATGNGQWHGPTARDFGDVFPGALWTPIKIMMVEKMVLALDVWTSLILGIIYLFFNAIPFTFRTLYNLYVPALLRFSS